MILGCDWLVMMLQDPCYKSGEHARTQTPGPGTTVHVATPGECSPGPMARVQSACDSVTVSLVPAAPGGMAGHSALQPWPHGLDFPTGASSLSTQ